MGAKPHECQRSHKGGGELKAKKIRNRLEFPIIISTRVKIINNNNYYKL